MKNKYLENLKKQLREFMILNDMEYSSKQYKTLHSFIQFQNAKKYQEQMENNSNDERYEELEEKLYQTQQELRSLKSYFKEMEEKKDKTEKNDKLVKQVVKPPIVTIEERKVFVEY
jgi:predicted  nucleic acid-binding Zn-ribbon protein